VNKNYTHVERIKAKKEKINLKYEQALHVYNIALNNLENLQVGCVQDNNKKIEKAKKILKNKENLLRWMEASLIFANDN
jgi:hypothetical protein